MKIRNYRQHTLTIWKSKQLQLLCCTTIVQIELYLLMSSPVSIISGVTAVSVSWPLQNFLVSYHSPRRGPRSPPIWKSSDWFRKQIFRKVQSRQISGHYQEAFGSARVRAWKVYNRTAPTGTVYLASQVVVTDLYAQFEKITMTNFQAKNQFIEVKDSVNFIAERTEEEVKQVRMSNSKKLQLETLKTETDTQKNEIAVLEGKSLSLKPWRNLKSRILWI